MTDELLDLRLANADAFSSSPGLNELVPLPALLSAAAVIIK